MATVLDHRARERLAALATASGLRVRDLVKGYGTGHERGEKSPGTTAMLDCPGMAINAPFARKLIESLSGASQIAGHIVLYPLLRGWRRRWGSTEEERALRLAGDELVRAPQWSYDHAISVAAPRSAVWPWLVQLGQGRGGFYSYEGLENLVGCQIRNVTEIRPELQQLEVGETVVLHGRSGFGPQVVLLDAERALVLGGPPTEKGSRATWGFYLLEGPDGTARLLERGRGVAGRGLAEQLGFGPYLMDPIGFVMSKKMLRTIKRLAETSQR